MQCVRCDSWLFCTQVLVVFRGARSSKIGAYVSKRNPSIGTSHSEIVGIGFFPFLLLSYEILLVNLNKSISSFSFSQQFIGSYRPQ